MNLLHRVRHVVQRRYASVSSLRNLIDEKYVLPYASCETSVILKTVSQNEQNRPLTSETLWDLIQAQHYRVYSSKNQMKLGITELRALGYLDYLRDQDGRYVIALTSKSKLIEETIDERKNTIEKWKMQSESLKDYILPGMTPDTALVIQILANAPYRKLPFVQLHGQLKESGHFDSLRHMKVILNQLKVMGYIYESTTGDDQAHRFVCLSKRVKTMKGKIRYCLVKRRRPFA